MLAPCSVMALQVVSGASSRKSTEGSASRRLARTRSRYDMDVWKPKSRAPMSERGRESRPDRVSEGDRDRQEDA